jgi:TolB-like protein
VRADAVGNADSYFGRLIGELQRRRVFRTAALYIVGAWLAMQVADVVFPALGISESALRFVLVGAVLGFPVALVFGWFYDIGAHGIRRTKAADVDASGSAQTLRRTDYVILTALSAVVIAILYSAIGNVVEAPRDRWDQDHDRPPMLAVLPFIATNATGESESFAAGVHDDLLTQLSKIQSIRVISRTSVMGYKDTVRNVREIGKELGADTILEGGVQSAGNQIRINAQLIDARTDEHLWAQTYDRELTLANIFEVQAEIARAITSAMRATLTEKDEDDLAALPTENMAAYRAYHQAIELRGKHGRTEDVIAMLEEATALDPMFTRAWAELVGSVSFFTFRKTEQEPKRVRQAEEALEHIRSIAPESSDYIVAQAYYTYYTLRDYDRALQLILRAQEMVPSDAHLFGVASWIQRRQGDFDGQIESLRRAHELDPKDRGRVEGLVHALIVSHYYDEAQSVLESTDIEEYYLSFLSSTLRVKDHRDFGLWAQDVVRLVTEFEGTDDFYSYDLWQTSIATRNFMAAEKFLSQMPGPADDPNPYHLYGTKLRYSVTTFFFLRKQEELAIAASQLRSVIDGGLDPDGGFGSSFAALDLALIEAVEGNNDEAVNLIRLWRRLASDDIADFVRGHSQACSIFGIVGASKEAVECLRNAFEKPSFAMPFIDPFFPHYDSIRDQPEFVELLAEIDGVM